MIHTVGVGDMKVSATRGDLIVTHALGSCLGIAIHDSVACVGGLLHVMLPLSTIDPAKADKNPFMFVDTGFPRLLIECFKAGAQNQRLEIRVAGGKLTAQRGKRLLSDRQKESHHIKEASLEGWAVIEIL